MHVSSGLKKSIIFVFVCVFDGVINLLWCAWSTEFCIDSELRAKEPKVAHILLFFSFLPFLSLYFQVLMRTNSSFESMIDINKYLNKKKINFKSWKDNFTLAFRRVAYPTVASIFSMVWGWYLVVSVEIYSVLRSHDTLTWWWRDRFASLKKMKDIAPIIKRKSNNKNLF